VKRVVVLRALGLGDLLTAVPALRALRRAQPDAELILAAPGWAQELLGRTLVDAVIDLDLRAQGGPAPEDAALPRALHGADLAVNLHGAGPQSSRLLVGARPARLLAYACPEVPATAEGPAWRPDDHEAVRWCRLLRWHGLACSEDDLRIDVDAALAAPAAAGATLLHPGAAGAARRWPPARWAAVARAERARGHDVVLTAGPGEVALAASVAAEAGLEPGAVLSGLGLAALAATVASAGRVVVGDTGLAHLAVAVGTPSLALFGPTSPRCWGPPPGRAWHRVLWHGQEDRPGDPHADVCDPALLAITVQEVTDALARLGDDAAAGTGPRLQGR